MATVETLGREVSVKPAWRRRAPIRHALPQPPRHAPVRHSPRHPRSEPPRSRSYTLCVILDVYSRYMVGWLVAEGEAAALAEQLIAETCRKQDVTPDRLTLYADRGGAMTSKTVALLLADLG